MTTGIDKCIEAFERLKVGKPLNEKFKGINTSEITPSIVSQEAGFDAGYLKNSRANHKPLIILINDFRNSSPTTTLSKREIIEREKKKTTNYKTEKILAESRLEEALKRELLLARKVRELEELVSKLQNGKGTLTRIPD
ncbi:TPA: hypothetical protein ACPHT2_002625 [Vibrio antiquarius]